MCTGIFARYLDCEKGHRIKTYHWCLKAHRYALSISDDNCEKMRIIYNLSTGPCPRCKLGYGTISRTEEEAREPES